MASQKQVSVSARSEKGKSMLQMLVRRRPIIRLAGGMFANRKHQQNQTNKD